MKNSKKVKNEKKQKMPNNVRKFWKIPLVLVPIICWKYCHFWRFWSLVSIFSFLLVHAWYASHVSPNVHKIKTKTEKLFFLQIRQKRQIYREQVQPHTGGKIPDSAFETDRLFLNRLQKEGIAVPDGVVLEQRNPKVINFQPKSNRFQSPTDLNKLNKLD